MVDTLQIFLGLVIILMVVGVLYAATKRRRKPTAAVVVIREGRLPGEPEAGTGIICRNCGRRFRHIVTFQDEVVKCPYCGSEVV